MAVTEARDYYRVLQVDEDAEPEVIAAAYRRLAAKYHPDVNPGPEATARMAELNTAYGVLKDPDSRAQYDRARGRSRRARATAAGPAGAGTTGLDMNGLVRLIIVWAVLGVVIDWVLVPVPPGAFRFLLAIAISIVISSHPAVRRLLSPGR